jgi:hypothetical protein
MPCVPTQQRISKDFAGACLLLAGTAHMPVHYRRHQASTLIKASLFAASAAAASLLLQVCLVALQLRGDGFENFRCDRNVTLGIQLANFSKLLKCAGANSAAAAACKGIKAAAH